MNIAAEMAKTLKQVSTPNGDDRLARAMFLANSMAFGQALTIPLALEAEEEAVKEFKSLVGDINDITPIDHRLAVMLFRRALRIRLELISGVRDPAILKACLTGPVAEEIMPEQEMAMNQWLSTRGDYAESQRDLLELVSAYFTKD